MGYVPEWSRANHAKNNGTSKTDSQSTSKYGIVSRELFQRPNSPSSNAGQTPFTRHYADGSEGAVEMNANNEPIGQYSGDDEIVKYRMNQIDKDGNDLRIPESAKTTQSQADAQDMDNARGETVKSDTSVKKETSADLDPYGAANKSSTASASVAEKAPAKSKPSKSAASKAVNDDPDYNVEPRDGYQRSQALKGASYPSTPAKSDEPKKPFIEIPKDSNIGMRQYQKDAESPMGSFFSKLTNSQSQRTAAANKNKSKAA